MAGPFGKIQRRWILLASHCIDPALRKTGARGDRNYLGSYENTAGGTVGTSDGVNAGHDGSGEQGAAGTEDQDPGLPVIAGKPSRIGISKRRAQQAARDRLMERQGGCAANRGCARKAASVVLPRATLARDELRDRIAVNPEVAEQVTVALLGSVMGAAGKHSGKARHAALKVALAGLARSGRSWRPIPGGRSAGDSRRWGRRLRPGRRANLTWLPPGSRDCPRPSWRTPSGCGRR